MMPRIGVGAPGPGRAGPATQAGPAFDSADSVTGMLLPARPGRGPAERGAGPTVTGMAQDLVRTVGVAGQSPGRRRGARGLHHWARPGGNGPLAERCRARARGHGRRGRRCRHDGGENSEARRKESRDSRRRPECHWPRQAPCHGDRQGGAHCPSRTVCQP